MIPPNRGPIPNNAKSDELKPNGLTMYGMETPNPLNVPKLRLNAASIFKYFLLL